MKHSYLIAFAFLAIVGCKSQEEKDVGSRAQQIIDSVTSELSDPTSAEFDNITMGYDPSNPSNSVLCGKVNAKNKFGGYVGFQNFSYINGDLKIETPDPSAGTNFSSAYESGQISLDITNNCQKVYDKLFNLVYIDINKGRVSSVIISDSDS